MVVRDLFTNTVEEAKTEVITKITLGLLTFEEYKRETGRLMGLNQALDLYRELVATQFKENKDF
jgi:hypothetical protein